MSVGAALRRAARDTYEQSWRLVLLNSALSAVASVPDARKGEKLVLVTDAQDATRADFLAYAKARNAMDLMVPAEVRIVAKVPVLGSGKIDFVTVTKMVSGEGQPDANPRAA